jgi:hypothetical protein
MDLNAIDVQEHDQLFLLKTLQLTKDLSKVSEVNLDQVTDKQVFGKDDDDSDKNDDKEAEKGVSKKDIYDWYLETTKDGTAKSGTKAAKRSKKLMKEKIAKESHKDQELLLVNPEQLDKDTKTYAAMLQGARDSDDDDDSLEDEEGSNDGFHAKPATPQEHAKKATKRQKT